MAGAGDVTAGARDEVDELAFVPADAATGDGGVGDSLDLHALEDVKVAGVVVGLGGDDSGGAGVPDDDVGVGADGDEALARIAVEELGYVGGGDGDELRRGEDARGHALVPHHGHAVLDAVDAVGNAAEVVLPQRLLVGV